KDHKHAGEIELLSFSWGVSNTGAHCAGGGGGAGKANFQDFSFVKRVDAATPKLMLTCATGEHIKSAVITVRKAGEKPVEFLKITLDDVLISSAQSGGAGAIEPQEQVSLNFAKFEVESNGSLSESFELGCRVG